MRSFVMYAPDFNVNRVYRSELRATEREIDEIVYRLFALTPNEIALIEKSLANVRAENSDDNEEENE